MTILFLISSLRSGSHMVRSMLRNDPHVVDERLEHAPIVETELADLHQLSSDVLVPLKYGFGAFTADCLAVGEHADACALILHRIDATAQALSLACARKNGSWFGPTDRSEPVTVSEADVTKLATRNARDLRQLEQLQIPHRVLAYEDISVVTLKAALDQLLQRDVTVTEPTTTKVAGRPPVVAHHDVLPITQ